MVLGEIGEHGDPDPHTGHSLLLQADGRCFDGTGFQSRCHKIAQSLLQGYRVGRSESGAAHTRQRHNIARQGDRAYAERTNNTAGHCARHYGQCLGQPPCRRSLSIRPRHSYQWQLARRFTIKLCSDGARIALQPRIDRYLRTLKPKSIDTLRFHKACNSTTGQSPRDKLATILDSAWPGYERICALDLTAINTQTCRTLGAQPCHCLFRRI